MAISIQSDGDVQVIRISREITLGRRAIGQVVDLEGKPVQDVSLALVDLVRSGHSKLLVDLSEVPFIDSAGLGELVALKKRTLEAGGDIRLLKPTRRVHQILEMLHLTSVFEVYEEEREAVAAFDG